jgi:hypothetical protein
LQTRIQPLPTRRLSVVWSAPEWASRTTWLTGPTVVLALALLVTACAVERRGSTIDADVDDRDALDVPSFDVFADGGDGDPLLDAGADPSSDNDGAPDSPETDLDLDHVDVDSSDVPDALADGDAAEPPVLVIRLEWTKPAEAPRAADLDLHFLHPAGRWNTAPYDCMWFNTNPDWGTAGVTDDDPRLVFLQEGEVEVEMITFEQPEGSATEPLTYRLGVFNFSSRDLGPTLATIQVFLRGSLVHESSREIAHRTFWEAAALRWPDEAVTPIDVLYPSGFP